MRLSRTLALLGVFAGGSAARAAEPAPAPAATVQQAPAAPAAKSDDLPWLGVMTDVGLPDGAQGSLVLRPWKALRFSVGGGTNMISKGVRAGVALLPFGRGPALAIEAGHYFRGDANAPIQKFAGPGFGGVDAINHFGYDYANAHLGLDFGYRRVTFYIHGGMSYLSGTIPKEDLNSTFNTSPSINGQNSSGLQVNFTKDAPFKAIGPSAKLGLIVYLW
jgi:hypothetical protein